MMLTQLGDVLRKAGLPVREIPGWKTAGHGAMAQVLGVLAHHTAGAAKGEGVLGGLRIPGYPSLDIVVNGRPGLDGPLANLGLTRDGTWVTVAAGQAWHAGTGSAPWCPANAGNSHLIGVEAESVGTRDDWTDAQRGSYPRGVAALLSHFNLPASRAIGHKEWTTRKIDPAFWGMNQFRVDVARWQATASKPPAAPAPRPVEDDVIIVMCESVPKGPIWTGLLSGGLLIGPLTPGELASSKANITALGAWQQWVERSTWDKLAAHSSSS